MYHNKPHLVCVTTDHRIVEHRGTFIIEKKQGRDALGVERWAAVVPDEELFGQLLRATWAHAHGEGMRDHRKAALLALEHCLEDSDLKHAVQEYHDRLARRLA